MNIKIDLKSIFLGLTLGVVAMLALGAATSTPAGRYQVATTPSLALMVDTTTGKTWLMHFDNNINPKGSDADFFSPKNDN
jgi:hypothetical protein